MRSKLLLLKICLTTALFLNFQNAYSQNCPSGISTVDLGNHKITYYGNSVDLNQNTSTWFYCAESGGSPEISHTIFEFPLCMNLNGSTSSSSGTWGSDFTDLMPGSGSPNFGNDPPSGIFGLKFDEGINTGDFAKYYFTLDNVYQEDEVEVAYKAGRNVYSGLIAGPSQSCECAGVYEIGGNVFNQDLASPNGLANVELKLRDENLNTIDFAYTDANGNYQFTEVPSGSYTIDVNENTVPSGTIATSSTGGLAIESVLSCNPAILNIPYRDQVDGLIGDLVWHDYCSPDGIPDATEMQLGLERALVHINVAGNRVSSAFSDSYGNYRVDGLAEGSYTVELDLSDPNIEAFIDQQLSNQISSNPVCSVGNEKGDGGNVVQLYADSTTPLTKTDDLPDGGVNMDFDFALIEGTLDVNLSRFELHQNEQAYTLKWTTQSEVEFSGFEIESSQEGQSQFSLLHFEPGKGGSNLETDYEFTLSNLPTGFHKFRLKMIDLDGSFEYSNQIETRVFSTDLSLQAFPNPSGSTTSIILDSSKEDVVEISLFDEQGRLVRKSFSGNIHAEQRIRSELDVSDLPAGLYVLLANGRTSSTKHLLVVSR